MFRNHLMQTKKMSSIPAKQKNSHGTETRETGHMTEIIVTALQVERSVCACQWMGGG